jgi:ribosomal protein L29
MKKRELQELRNRPAAELSRLAQEGTEKLRSLRFDLAAGKVKNVNELRVLRKTLARIQTFMRENNKKIK